MERRMGKDRNKRQRGLAAKTKAREAAFVVEPVKQRDREQRDRHGSEAQVRPSREGERQGR